MYVIPLIALLLIAMGIFFGPLLAVIVFAVFLGGLGAYKFLGRGTEPEHTPRAHQPTVSAEGNATEEEETGAWGETWPEQSR
jgi:hypothetical protein